MKARVFASIIQYFDKSWKIAANFSKTIIVYLVCCDLSHGKMFAESRWHDRVRSSALELVEERRMDGEPLEGPLCLLRLTRVVRRRDFSCRSFPRRENGTLECTNRQISSSCERFAMFLEFLCSAIFFPSFSVRTTD